jgi:hypothetical protein
MTQKVRVYSQGLIDDVADVGKRSPKTHDLSTKLPINSTLPHPIAMRKRKRNK